jgi:hypothetical protein
LFVSGVLANLGAHLLDPNKDLLVGETVQCKDEVGSVAHASSPVQRTGETVQRGTEGKEGIRKSRADEFSGVSRDVATFVIAGGVLCVQFKLETQELTSE